MGTLPVPLRTTKLQLTYEPMQASDADTTPVADPSTVSEAGVYSSFSARRQPSDMAASFAQVISA